MEGIVFVYIFGAISFASHLNEYSQFACSQQLIRCFLFANVNESLPTQFKENQEFLCSHGTDFYSQRTLDFCLRTGFLCSKLVFMLWESIFILKQPVYAQNRFLYLRNGLKPILSLRN